MADTEMTVGQSSTLRANSFTKTGYVFSGWATSPGGAVKYSDKQTVSLFNSGGVCIDLYAQWKPVSGTQETNESIAINNLGYNMKVNVGRGSTLRFCSTVSTADKYELGSIPNGTTVYVYGTTTQQYENRTWAKIQYNGVDGWVNYKWLS